MDLYYLSYKGTFPERRGDLVPDSKTWALPSFLPVFTPPSLCNPPDLALTLPRCQPPTETALLYQPSLLTSQLPHIAHGLSPLALSESACLLHSLSPACLLQRDSPPLKVSYHLPLTKGKSLGPSLPPAGATPHAPLTSLTSHPYLLLFPGSPFSSQAAYTLLRQNHHACTGRAACTLWVPSEFHSSSRVTTGAVSQAKCPRRHP